MTITRYANDTHLRTAGMWDVYAGGSAMCADGIVRRLKRIAITADTFFSIPAAVSVRGRTVSGYVSITDLSDANGNGTANDPQSTVTFHATGKNREMLPHPRECEHFRAYGEHAFSILLSVPVKMMGAITDHVNLSECADCGHRVPTSTLVKVTA